MKQAEVKAQIANAELGNEYDETKYQEFIDQMADDLNTPNAYMVIFDTLKLLNQALRVKEIDFKAVGKEYNAIEKMLEILGIFIDRTVLSDEDRQIYRNWNEAKANKDFETADKYRSQLIEKGIL